MGYTKDVVKGFTWVGGIRIITRVMSFIRTLIIARILTPSQFGVFGIATIILSLMEVITETGINVFLIQKKDDIDKYISTAWVTSIARGLIISIIIFIAAPFIADFYSISDSVYTLQLVALIPFIRGFINPSVVKFTKDLTFHKEFYYRTGIFFVETIVSLALVFIYPSPTSLVWGLVFGAIYEVILSFSMSRPIPDFVFEKTRLREVISRGKWLTFTGIFSYLYQNGDDLVVGKMLGTSSLGLYQMAYKISLLPLTEGTDVFGKVTFPVFVKIAHDIPRLRRAYFRSVSLVAAFAIPIGIIIALYPEQIIRLLLGEQWLEASAVLQVLALFGILRAISISVLSPIYALNKQEYVTHITIINFLGMAVTIIPFITMWGLVGAGYSALLGTLISIPLLFYYLYKIFRSPSK